MFTANTFKVALMVLLAGLVSAMSAFAQSFDSGSNGSDGALVLDTPGTIVFYPGDFDPPLDVDHDGIYHFTTITVAAGVTVRLGADRLGTQPVIWLATGDVVINGTLDLSGDDGYDSGELPRHAVAGAGGFNGGLGSTSIVGATPGEGPGGGGVAESNGQGGGAGHTVMGMSAEGEGGAAYGNSFLRPLIGGSGGAGGGPKTPDGGSFGGGGASGGW